MVYCMRRPRCCWLSVAFGVSTVVISVSFGRVLLYLRYLHNYVSRQFRLTGESIGSLELLVRFVRRGWRQVLPALADLDPARPACAVAPADLADLDAELPGDRQHRLSGGKLTAFQFVFEGDPGHARRDFSVVPDEPCRSCEPGALIRRDGTPALS